MLLRPAARAAGGLRGAQLFGIFFALLFAVSDTILAQEAGQRPQAEPDSPAADTTQKPVIMQPIAVTATRDPKEIFVIAAPVSVIDTTALREQTPNTASDILKSLPGIDVNGVGTNQTRPTIRGQRGQRILLLEDGLRINNARRQQDFGELPAIVDLNNITQLEVVRGPASVLYGTDAIGGVVNLRTSDVPSLASGDTYGGRVRFLYRDEGEQVRPTVDMFGRIGQFGFRGTASYRNAKNYSAPAGSFGDIVLGDAVEVNDTGVKDQNYSLLLDYSFDARNSLFAKGEYYKATDAGFGYVSNDDLGTPDDVSIVIQYPDQHVGKLTAGYRGHELGWGFADRLDITGFYMDNERELVQDIGIPNLFGPGMDVNLRILNQNFTDIESFGVRTEAAKLIGGRHLVTYGFDFYHDDSQNTDDGTSVISGADAPPIPPETSDVPNVPNARYDRFGVYAQSDLQLHRKVSLILGARWQNVRSETKETENLEDPGIVGITNNDQTVVASANLLVEVAPFLNLVGTVGRGFRAPNLVELYFNGATPEGSGFLVPNTDLSAETSLNIDVGLKYRRQNVAFEAFVFRNKVFDGIRIAPVPDSVVGPFPVFQNVNVDEILYRGLELGAEWAPVVGLSLGAGFSFLDADNVFDENDPIADSYRTKLTADVTYREPAGKWWASYDFRLNGAQTICADSDVECRAQVVEPAVGLTLPSFNVHNLRAGFRIAQIGRTSHYLTASLENFTDELYAEFSNATFFRPQPRRTFLIGWTSTF